MSSNSPTKIYDAVKYKSEIAAVQAIAEGVATDDQQKRGLDFIINVMCDTYGFHYHKDDRDTVFALGKKFVGDLIVGALKTNLGNLK